MKGSAMRTADVARLRQEIENVIAVDQRGNDQNSRAGAIAAMRVAGLTSVRYRSRKPPAAWRGSPAERTVDLDRLTRRTVLYKGTAGEAALLYPQNANVAAAVALAGLGFDATEVELVADPDAPGNIHEIEAEGVAGQFAIQLQGKASRTNPKTSALAALSVARALLNRHATIVI